jgi:hypothetical protein
MLRFLQNFKLMLQADDAAVLVEWALVLAFVTAPALYLDIMLALNAWGIYGASIVGMQNLTADPSFITPAAVGVAG